MSEEQEQEQVQEIVEEVPEPPARKPRKRPVAVRTIQAKSGSALVEWVDNKGLYRRVFVPMTSITDGVVDLAELDKGIPYGLPWEDYIEVTATPEGIANDLRKRGVWTFRDLSNMSAVMKANQASTITAFMQRAKKEASK